MSSPDMVTCALHGRSRLAKFCIEKPVYDAFGKIVRTSYECLDTASCLKGNLKKTAEREQQSSSFEALGDDDVTNEDNNNNLIKDSSSNNNVQLSNVDMLLASKALPTKKNTFADMTTSDDADNNKTSNTTTTTDDTSKPSDVAKIISAGANRYYDLSRIGDTKKDDPINKLCFICGQSGHERPKCPNVVCRKCRLPGCKGYPETCRPQQGLETPCSLLGVPSQKKGGFSLSQIARKSSSNYNNKDSSSSGSLVAPLFIGTRCTLCRQEGHLDCAHLSNPPNWKEQCIVCGRVGHYGLACPSRRFDRWVDDMRRFASSGSRFSNNNSGQQSYGSGSAGNFGSHGRYGSNDDSTSSMKCFNCGQTGHISRECPEGRRQYNNNNNNNYSQQDRHGGGGGGSGGAPPSTMECYNCGRTGHLSRDCPDRRGQYESGNRRGRDHYNDHNNYNNYNNNNRYGERTQNEDRDMRRGGNYNNNNNNYNNNRPPRSYSGGGGGGGGGGRRR